MVLRLAGDNHLEIHRRVYCTGYMVGTRGVPGRRGPGISYIYPDAGSTPEIWRTILGFLLCLLPDDQDVKSAIVGIIYEGNGTSLFNRNRRNCECATLCLNGVGVVARC